MTYPWIGSAVAVEASVVRCRFRSTRWASWSSERRCGVTTGWWMEDFHISQVDIAQKHGLKQDIIYIYMINIIQCHCWFIEVNQRYRGKSTKQTRIWPRKLVPTNFDQLYHTSFFFQCSRVSPVRSQKSCNLRISRITKLGTALVGLGVGTRTSQVTTSHLDVSWQQPAVVEGFWTRTLMVMIQWWWRILELLSRPLLDIRAPVFFQTLSETDSKKTTS